MRFCAQHVDQLRQALDAQGLIHSSPDREMVQRTLIARLRGYPVGNPFIGASLAVTARVLEKGGLGLFRPDAAGDDRCPLCEVERRGGEVTAWIEGACADEAANSKAAGPSSITVDAAAGSASVVQAALVRHVPGHANEAVVDCGSCRACCHHQIVVLGEDEDPSEYDLEPGTRWLRHDPETDACVYLGPQGCTIYERRPMLCRIFHCGLWHLGTEADKRAAMQALSPQGAKMVRESHRRAARILAAFAVEEELLSHVWRNENSDIRDDRSTVAPAP